MEKKLCVGKSGNYLEVQDCKVVHSEAEDTPPPTSCVAIGDELKFSVRQLNTRMR